MENIKIWLGEIGGYKLLDSGEGEKLEEINGIKIIRKEPRAWWKKSIASSEYQDTREKQKNGFETILDTGINGVKAKIKFKETSKHIGIFPEQIKEWQWIKEKTINQELRFLNLFGYTGIASLVGAGSGAKVTHVDASKQSIDWARENQKISGMEDLPIRWIVDDVSKFLKKEIKRGENLPDQMGGYDAIIMDPPSYGKGPKGEVWKAEDKLLDLLNNCKAVLSDKPKFIILNMYSTELSSISLANMLGAITYDMGGKVESGELVIKQENSEKMLPMSIFAKWENI